jgi:hypothetical protein
LTEVSRFLTTLKLADLGFHASKHVPADSTLPFTLGTARRGSSASEGIQHGKSAKVRVFPAKFVVEIQRSNAIPTLLSQSEACCKTALASLTAIEGEGADTNETGADGGCGSTGKLETGAASPETTPTAAAAPAPSAAASIVDSVTKVSQSAELKFYPRLTTLILSILHRCVISCSCNALRGEFKCAEDEMLLGFGRRRMSTPKSTVASIEAVKIVHSESDGGGSGDSHHVAGVSTDTFIQPTHRVNAIVTDLLTMLESSPVTQQLANVVLVCLRLARRSCQV